MPSLADSITSLKVGVKVFKNPEWWASSHKIKREVKNSVDIKDLYKEKFGKVNIRTSYNVVTRDEMPSADVFVKRMQASLDYPEFSKYAPWNPVFRKLKTLIMFDK